MTFISRMMTETGAPQPRWRYLQEKLGDTALIALLVWRATPLDLMESMMVATAIYVGIGMFLWYKNGVKRWFGPGSFTGDLFYHLSVSLVVVSLAVPTMVWVSVLWITLLWWWIIDGAGYGPMRGSPEQ